MRDNGGGPGLTSWSMRDVSPRLLIGDYDGFIDRDELWVGLDELQPGLRVQFADAFLDVFLDVVTNGDPADFGPTAWPRFADGADGRQTWWKLDPADTIPSRSGAFQDEWSTCAFCIGPTGCPQPSSGIGARGDRSDFHPHSGYRHAEQLWRALPYMVNVGMERGQLDTLATWSETMWPDHDWSTYADPAVGCPPAP